MSQRRHRRTEAGKAIYKRANCFGCHKWHGDGGGDTARHSLRATELTRDQIVETRLQQTGHKDTLLRARRV